MSTEFSLYCGFISLKHIKLAMYRNYPLLNYFSQNHSYSLKYAIVKSYSIPIMYKIYYDNNVKHGIYMVTLHKSGKTAS